MDIWYKETIIYHKLLIFFCTIFIVRQQIILDIKNFTNFFMF